MSNQSNKISVNLITGGLGSGKTTLIRQLLKQKPPEQKWALIVNEFGTIGIDNVLIDSTPGLQIETLPGGCICCSAQTELKSVLIALQNQPIDRILIEPTGLSEPDGLVDVFLSHPFNKAYQLDTLISVMDASNLDISELQSLQILQSLLHMADLVVLNKIDQTSQEHLQNLNEYLDQVYPPIPNRVMAEQGQIPIHLLLNKHVTSLSGLQPQTCTFKLQTLSLHRPHTHSPVKTELPYSPLNFKHLIERQYQAQIGIQSLGWVWNNSACFEWQTLHALFQQLNQHPQLQGVKRAKGVFNLGKSRMLFQWVHQQTTRELIPYRKDSRFEILIDTESAFDFVFFENQLANCLKP
jgi:G3E family GTPase